MPQEADQHEMLAMTIARGHVKCYDDIIRQSHEADDCFDCEAFLRLGIEAFKSVIYADNAYRKAVYSEAFEHDPNAEKELIDLLREWIKSIVFAEQWAKVQLDRGFDVCNLEEFRQCGDEALAMVASFDDAQSDRIMAAPLIVLRDQAIQEHQSGQTAEFF